MGAAAVLAPAATTAIARASIFSDAFVQAMIAGCTLPRANNGKHCFPTADLLLPQQALVFSQPPNCSCSFDSANNTVAAGAFSVL